MRTLAKPPVRKLAKDLGVSLGDRIRLLTAEGRDDLVTIEGISGGDNRFLFTPGPAPDSAQITGYDQASRAAGVAR